MYTEFYRLHGEPFLLTPDHRFYFDSSVHSQAMAHLTYGLTQGEGFIVITGDIGAGKTTLVKRLCASIDSQRIVAAHVVTTQLEGYDLLRMVAAAFGLNDIPPDKSSLILQLHHFFAAAHKQRCRVLLIVDEAQNLPVGGLEELRMLSNFQIGNVALFQSFLVGQPQFRAVLASPQLEQLRQRVIASYHLGPMNRDECANYLVHRLQKVGWRSDPTFDTSAVDAIFIHTGGIPRRINTLCNRLLLLGFLDDLHNFSADEVNKVWADLEVENPPHVLPDANGSVGKPRQLPAGDTDIRRRVAGLERRVADQEAFAKRVTSALDAYLHFDESESR
jgi:putative secretion ATPase (PEP-CTERM system associated)